MTVLDAHTHPHFREHQAGRAAADVFLREARRHGIEHVVALGDVLAFGRSPNADQLRSINDDTLWLVKRHPQQVTGFCYLNPTLGERAVATPEDFDLASIAALYAKTATTNTPAGQPSRRPSAGRPRCPWSCWTTQRGRPPGKT
jgi:hypothetical protein